MPAHNGHQSRIRGSIPALITPFRNNAVDERALQALVEKQAVAGARAVTPCGTTGEAATLTLAEHRRVVELTVEAAAGKVAVIAGAGSNNTAHSIELARLARSAGADAVLVVAPYYSKPSQEGLYAHFKAINDAVDIPIVVYNVPSRTVADVSVETMSRLSALPNVIGVKDATGDMTRVARHAALCGSGFIQLSGDDPSAVGHAAMGGLGCISVTANAAPKQCAALHEAALAGDFAAARGIDAKLADLHRALFVEPSPAPVKYACSLLGLCTEEVRLPMIACSDGAKAHIRAAMQAADLL